MKAEYDSQADAVLIEIAPVGHGEVASGNVTHDRSNVSVVEGRPVSVELLYPDLGIDEPLAAAAEHFDLDLEALQAAVRSTVAARDRTVTLEVAGRS